jgi:hypothetical protein
MKTGQNSSKKIKPEPKTKTPRKRASKPDTSGQPLMAMHSSTAATTTRTRRNKAAGIQQTDRFVNIDKGMVPFNYSTTGYGNKTSNIDVRDAVVLCQKAYYNFSVFRNAIDMMAEFSCSDIYLTEGTKKSKEFFSTLFSKVNMWSLQDRFFREYYRSGNVFVYRFDSKILKSDLNKMTRTFGLSAANQKYIIPARYVVLNPADIQVGGNISFAVNKYYKRINGYELSRLRNPRTEEDKEVYNGLEPELQKEIKTNSEVAIPLNEEKINAVFYKKQDYEPLAVPMGYPVLDDINWKAEMKKMDMAVSRTMQQTILLVTMGTDPDKGGVNQQNLAAMQDLFTNESVGRVLIADYTTKASFVVPEIGSILDPKKYEVVDKDIAMGLSAIITGGTEKFANQSVKIEMFVARLRQARKAFLNQFLMPEIKRIAKDLGFKGYPTAHFHKLSIKNDPILARIYARFVEMGIMTPEEGMQAIESGRLPLSEESVESQQEYKKLRSKGLYEPMVGGPETQKDLSDRTQKGQMDLQKENIKSQEKMNKEKMKSDEKKAAQKPAGVTPQKNGAKPAPKTKNGPAGRPGGTSSPQTTKKVSPIGAKYTKDGKAYKSYNFLLTKVKDCFIEADKLNKKVETSLKRKHKVKELSEDQRAIAFDITKIIVANEEPKNWSRKAKDYIKNPIDTNPDRIKEIQIIAAEHQVDDYLASILYISKE